MAALKGRAMAGPIVGICADHVELWPQPDEDRCHLKLYPHYYESIQRAGGVPMILPMVDEIESIRPLLDLCGGVLMIGADDYPPEWFGKTPIPEETQVTPRRARFDKAIAEYLYRETDLPVLGICGGMQLQCILTGGTLIQDLPPGDIQHRRNKDGYQTHAVKVEEGSVLHKAIGETEFEVNSLHHQAIEAVAGPLKVSAHAPDGTVEAIEFSDHNFRVGVQWHPERMPESSQMQRLFKAFVDSCAA
jgi:putative glutamine amidotransferase